MRFTHWRTMSSWMAMALLAGLTAGSAAEGPKASNATATPTMEQIAAAEAALKQAQDAENAAKVEWDSREMARSATREIAAAERVKLDKARKAKQSADNVVNEIAAELKSAEQAAAGEADPDKKQALATTVRQLQSELEELKQFAAQKAAQLEQAVQRFNVEQALYDQQQANLDAMDMKVAQAVLATHTANVRLHELRFGAAQAAAQTAAAQVETAKQAIEGKTDQEKLKAEQACAECAKAAKEAADKCSAAHRALTEAQLVAALEQLGWNQIYRDRLAAEANRKDQQARGAHEQAAKENDPARKQSLEQVAAKASREHAEALASVRQLEDAIRKAVADRYAIVARLEGGLEPLPIDQWDYAKARHLLVRAGFGGTPQEVQRLYEMGLYAAVDHLLDFAFAPSPNIPFEALAPHKPDVLTHYAGQTRVPGAKDRVQSRRLHEEAQFGALRQWWIRRLVESPRPLQEKLTLFWHGHFATQQSVVKHAYSMYQQNQLFREHASGNFGALLYGITHDAAMLRYLDNNQNVKGKPNENLAREIMELFAMGEGKGYTEQDIVQAARALTGYTYDHFSGEFRYIHDQHDTGEKTIFGRTGPWTGDDVVTLILEQPATSRFIAGKLFAFFAHDQADSQTIESLASVLRANQYELTPMLRNLFLSKQFYSEQAMSTQIKCPVQLVVGALRDTGVRQLSDYGMVEAALRDMGQDLFEPPDVKGWRYGRNWISSNRVFVRYNAVSELVRNAPQPGGKTGVDVIALLPPGACVSSEQIVDGLVKACMSKPLPAEKRQELIQFLSDLPPCGEWEKRREEVNGKLRQALVLMVSTPEYQMG